MSNHDQAKIVHDLLQGDLDALKAERRRTIRHLDEAVSQQKTWEDSIARLNEKIAALEDFMSGITALASSFRELEQQIRKEAEGG